MKLEGRNIVVERGGRCLLDRVSLSSSPGKIVGLIGPNGAGKSTLLKVMAGLLTPTGGEVRFDKKKISDISVRERAQNLAFLPQEHVVYWPITVYDLVAMGRLPYRRPLRLPDAADREVVDSALSAMSIESLAHRAANELSGGELARVLLARALAQTPKILLADEPTAGLDPAHKLRLLHHLSAVSKQGLSVILVLHDLGLAARFCDRLVLLSKGRIYDEGAPRKVLAASALEEVYSIRAKTDWSGSYPSILPLEVAEPTP